MEITSAVAINVKAIREGKKLTLDAAAEATGVSRSMLAQIEKGDVNPTISVLWKIANGFKVSFTSLVERRGEGVRVIRAGELGVLSEDEGRYVNYPTFAFDEQKLFECYRIEVEPGGKLHAQPHLKGAEEWITVFAGEVEVAVEAEVFQLQKGDSIRFLADVPHAYHNIGSVQAQMSMLIYYNR